MILNIVLRGLTHGVLRSILLFAAWASTAADLDPTVVGIWKPQGMNSAYSLRLDGNRLLACTLTDLVILDVSDPTQPTQLGRYRGTGNAFGAEVDGPRVYLAAGSAGVHVLDISNPATPQRLGGYNTRGTATRLVRSGPHLLVADGRPALTILDVSNPAAPSWVGELNSGSTSDVLVSGNLAYLAGSGLMVVDISNPAQPLLVTNVSAGNQSIGTLARDGNLLFGSAIADGLVAFDLTDPRAPRRLTSGFKLNSCSGVAAVAGQVVLAGWAPNLAFFDTRNGEPFPLNGRANPTAGQATSVAMDERHAYLAVDGRVYVIRWPTPSALPRVAHFAVPIPRGNTPVAAAADHTVQLASYSLYSLNTTNPLAPVWSATNSAQGIVSSVGVAGTRAVVNSMGRIGTWDLKNPFQPVALGLSATVGFPSDALASDSRRAFLAGFNHLTRLDLAQTAEPAVVARRDNDIVYRGLALMGDRLYATTQGPELICYDVGGDTNLMEISRQSLPGIATQLAADGDRLYVAGGVLGWLQIHSLSQPDSFPLIGTFTNLNSPQAMALRHPYLYLGSAQSGLEVLDIRDPANIRRVGGNSVVRTSTLTLDDRALYAFSSAEGAVLPLFGTEPAYQPAALTWTDHTLTFQVRGIPGTRVSLQRAMGLEEWSDWQTVEFPSEAPVQLKDSPAANSPAAFYRVFLP